MKKGNSFQAKETRTLGPISDLERHLPSEWWKKLFNAVYLKTDGDVVENDQNTSKDIDLLISTAQLDPSHRILDLCCGQGRHSIELARRGFSGVTGVDRSRYLVRLAKKRAKQEDLSVSFKEGDARKFRLPAESFDCVTLMGNSFGYFERIEDDLKVLDSIWRVLKPGGCIVLDVVDGEWMRSHFEPRSWEWIDQNHFVCRERALAEDAERLISREVVTHAERGVIADQFYAERLYSFAGLQALLKDSRFLEVEQCKAPETLSERQQDLGMLTKRITVIARKSMNVSTVPPVSPMFPTITILLGDPSLPDTVKREGIFSEEDLSTIHKVQEALAEVPGYTFNIWDSHENLISMLSEDKPEFVLNLCDEGYHNDAFMELHVPALLEMYNVPYSGAGPKCLGLCYDKALVRSLAQSLGIAVPLESYFSPDDQMATIPSIFPALIKPNFGDSSEGITVNSVIRSKEEFIKRWEELRVEFPDRPLLVQEFLDGAEYSVGVIGNPGLGYTVLPVLEVDFSGLSADLPNILGYESKWHPNSPYWTDIKYRKAELEEGPLRSMTDASLMLFERLGCRDYARFDFRADSTGQIKLLEANPNPGWCWDGKLNFMAEFAGLSYPDLLRLIIESAQSRYNIDKMPMGTSHKNFTKSLP